MEPSGVCVIQADSRPLSLHGASRPLVCDPRDDRPRRMRELNGGSLARHWDHWSLSFLINRLKCRILGYEHRFVPLEPRHHPDRHVTWGKVRVLLDCMAESPPGGIVVFLDSDAFVRDERSFAALLGALAADPSRHGALSRDPIMPKNTFINTGCLVLKNDGVARDFLEAVWGDADRNPRFRREWPHEQHAASAWVEARRDSFLVCKPAVLNTPCGQIVRHCWWKNLFRELAEDELASTLAGICFPEQASPAAPFDLAALLDP